jgi:glutathione S-transferase
MKFAKDWVLRGMDTFEALLEKTKGKYCFGDDLTLADCFFYPQVLGGINRFGVEIDKYPNSRHVLQNLQEVEAFRLAEPKNQPDFEA